MMSLTCHTSSFVCPNPTLHLHSNTSPLHIIPATPSIHCPKKMSTFSPRGHRLHAKNNIDQENDTQKAYGNSSSNQSSNSFLSFLCPLLKLFSGGDPSRERNYLLEEATSSLSSLARLPWGTRSLVENSNSLQHRPVDPPISLQLYEFEACPFCRRVREAITELDLSVEIYPCPKGSARHRQIVRKLGGKDQYVHSFRLYRYQRKKVFQSMLLLTFKFLGTRFPFLFDPNTGTSLYESSDIVKYLFQQYGEGRKPSIGLLESTLFTGWVPTLLRAGRGMTLWEKSKQEPPPEKLELFSYENNPYARIVREVLCELELPYILQSVGEGSVRIKLLTEISGSKEVPFLADPNTGKQISDYKKIVSYLIETYSVAAG
ncbi:hypothetical protein Leryth_017632 [Lithospermum erythrorhizon]|nr:hypothetical protein Leryth_017632 [Lithospermum erythrorhizon]